jgi:hypothetical protein
VLLISLQTFSQKTVLDKNGDTTICFSVAQSKFLLKKVYALDECDTLRKICEKQLTYCDSISVANKTLSEEIKNLLSTEQEIFDLYENQLKEQRKATRKQAFYKWCAILGGGVVSSYFAINYVRK